MRFLGCKDFFFLSEQDRRNKYVLHKHNELQRFAASQRAEMRVDVPTRSLVKNGKTLEGKWWSVDLNHLSGITLTGAWRALNELTGQKQS